jgi:hypothetical protein
MCSSRSSSSSSRSWADSSFLDLFDPFFLHWFELWHELSLSTEGNQPIPHEPADRVISWSRSQEPVFFVPFRFPVDWLQIRQWPLRGSSPTVLWSRSQSFVAVGEGLAANRKIEVRRRFSELSVLADSRFADCPEYCSGQSRSRDFFYAFFAARCLYLRTVWPLSTDCLGVL